MGIRWKVWVLDLETERALPIARTTIDLAKVAWLPDGKRLCLWHTSKYPARRRIQTRQNKGLGSGSGPMNAIEVDGFWDGAPGEALRIIN